VARDVQGHEVPQLLHKEAEHLPRQLELVVAREAVSGDVQVSAGWAGATGQDPAPSVHSREGPMPATITPQNSGKGPC
jgi:hypothetical protein